MLRLPTIMIGVDQNSPSLDSPYSSVASYNIRMHGTFGRQFHLTTRIHECAFGSPNAHANRTTHSSWSRLAGQIAWSYQVGEILFPFHLIHSIWHVNLNIYFDRVQGRGESDSIAIFYAQHSRRKFINRDGCNTRTKPSAFDQSTQCS